MRVIFDGPRRITLFLGGNPDKMERVAPQRGFMRIEETTDARQLAESLEDAANWVRMFHEMFPDDDVDCWIEVEGG